MTLPLSTHSAVRAPTKVRGVFTAFSPTTRRVILEWIGRGKYPSVAAAKAGIHYATLKRWLDRGYNLQTLREEGARLEPEDRAYADFYRAFARAEAEHESAMLEKVEEIGDSERQWTAFMTILERRYPDRWKKREQTEVVGVGGGDLKVQVDNSPQQLREVLIVLAESGALPGLLQAAGLSPAGPGSVIDAEAHEVHSPPPDAEAAGGDAAPER